VIAMTSLQVANVDCDLCSEVVYLKTSCYSVSTTELNLAAAFELQEQ
jgi:hypothetical protein